MRPEEKDGTNVKIAKKDPSSLVSCADVDDRNKSVAKCQENIEHEVPKSKDEDERDKREIKNEFLETTKHAEKQNGCENERRSVEKTYDQYFVTDVQKKDFVRVLGNNVNDSNDESEEEEEEEEETRFLNKTVKAIFIKGGDAQVQKKELNGQYENDSSKKGSGTKKTKKKKRALSLVDILISILIVGPLVIGHWRGIWTLMDCYNEMFPGWLCFLLGTGLHTLFAILKNRLHGKFVQELDARDMASRVGYRVVKLFYMYIFSVACNMQWRGGWIILDDCLKGIHTWIIACLTCMLLGGLIVLRCVRNLLAPPFIVVVDRSNRVFQFPTRYNVSTRDWSLYILDCAFSVGVVGTLVVFVWRGVWILFEIYLFPGNREYSTVGSLIIGYTIVAVTFSLQPLMRYACAHLQGLLRLVAADAFLFFSFLGTVNVWRGIWNVLDLWLLPNDPDLSCWITHIGCFVFLVLLNCSNSILVRGVYIDAEEDEGKCVVFPCHYLRLFFKIEREKKEARRRNLIVASKDLSSRTEANEKEAENGVLLNSPVSPILPGNPESLV